MQVAYPLFIGAGMVRRQNEERPMTSIAKQIVTAAQIASALAIAVLALPAQAQDRETRRVAVDYSDLNLATHAGRKTLDSRLYHASRNACGGQPSIGDLAAFMDYRKCYTVALDGAATQLAAKTGVLLAAR